MKVLLIPSLKKNGGTGHLRRCARLLSFLGPGSRILSPSGPDMWTTEEIISRFGLDKDIFTPHPEGGWDYLIFDSRETSKKDFFSLSCGRPALGLDEGGEARPLFSFLIDTFPRLSSGLPANIRNEALAAEGPPQPPRIPETLKTALLSFGGEDPENLTGLTLTAFAGAGVFPLENTGIVEGPAFRIPPPEHAGRVYKGMKDLRPLFESYDCVFTSFGITPYEVLKAGGIPILVNPTAYHEKLSRKAGFYSLGIKRISKRRLKRVQSGPENALRRLGKKVIPEGDFATILENFSPAAPSICPVCGSPERQPLERNAKASFFRCGGCGITYREGFSGRNIRYDKNYFFDDYRRQYGKTYLEDFSAIAEFSRQRLGVLESLCNGLEGKTLLDIGCAYGPFVSAAREAGCIPQGIDIAEDAIRHVRDTLNISALHGDFLSIDKEKIAPRGLYDMITLWFVIEHFRAAGEALRKASGLLKKGGFLAFATPNGRGVSGRFFLRDFLEKSPADHYTIWESQTARRVLKRFGFKVRKIRFTGHHPERFPRFLRFLFRHWGCGVLSRVFGLGDTFEVYAEKIL
jgi:2-polyprenyl-3-methyl-5-hydroxy-6-metoxy-1,4-benzoquinol methylase/spore coat polysaccharide biosynthesis predicted glycosyltransferase SpsG